MALPQGLSVGIDVLGIVLLHFLWQGAALGLIYRLLRPLCSAESARYILGLLALVALGMTPLFTAIYLWPGAVAAADMNADDVARSLQAVVAVPHASTGQLQAWLPWLVAAWLGGVITLAARSLWQWRKLLRLVHTAEALGPEWQTRLQQLCECFGLSQRVRLLCSASALTPMLIGWIKPVILLPASMLSGFAPHQVELIIAHELGHIRRFDYIINLFQVAIETILFYHPVVHWISRDVRNAREACCDDLVLRLTRGNRVSYARALAQLEELRLAPALGAGGGALLARVRRIVGETEAPEPLPRSYALPIALVLIAFFALIWRPQHRPEAEAMLQRISAKALALVSGNPWLIERPALAFALPVPEIQPVQRSALKIAPATATVVAPPTASRDVAESVAPLPASAPAVPAPSPPVHEAELSTAAPEAPAPHVAEKSSPLHVVAPVYPPGAMSAGIEGAVELEYLIDGGGYVRQIRVLHAQPVGVFEAAAKTALSAWRFPASSSAEKRTQNFAFTLHGHNHVEEQCQAPTGTLICRRPGD